MVKFKLKAKVERTVLDTIRVNVNADNIEEARALAVSALNLYPGPHTHPEVGYIYVENRDTLGTSVLTVEEDFPPEQTA